MLNSINTNFKSFNPSTSKVQNTPAKQAQFTGNAASGKSPQASPSLLKVYFAGQANENKEPGWRGRPSDKIIDAINLTKETEKPLPKEMRSDLAGYDFSEINLSNTNLTGANLGDADLINADLSNANLTNAYLGDADLQDAYLIKTNLTNADLSNADLRNAYLIGAKLNGAKLRCADLRNADLTETDFRDADLRDADFRGGSLIGSILKDAKYSNFTMFSIGTKIISGEQLYKKPEIVDEYFNDMIFVADKNSDNKFITYAAN